MDLGKTLLIGGAAAAGAGLVYLAARGGRGARVVQVTREMLEAAPIEAVARAAMPLAEPAAAVVRKAVKAVSGIPQLVLDNFKKYNLVSLIDKHAGGLGLPFGLAAGIIYVESKGDAEIVNKKSGAAGLVQIMPKYPRGLTKEQRLDPDAALRVIVPEWRDFLQWARDAGVTDERDQWSYVYYGHNQGRGALQIVLPYAKEGFEGALQHYRSFSWLRPKSYKDEVAAAKKAGRKPREMTAEERAAYDAAVAAHIKQCIKMARIAADKGAEFAAAEASLKGGAAVVGAGDDALDDDAPPVGRDGGIEALRDEVQAAYLARDLDRVAALEAELAALTGNDDLTVVDDGQAGVEDEIDNA